MRSEQEKPLDSFPAVRSREPDEIRKALAQTYGVQRLGLPRGIERLDVKANHWQSQNVAVSFCSYGAPVEVEFPGADFYRIQFSLIGAAEIQVDKIRRDVTSEQTAIVPPETALINCFPAGYEQLVLRINEHALNGKVAATIGEAHSRRVEFEPVSKLRDIVALRRILGFFVEELDNVAASWPQLAFVELEQTLILSFLWGNRNNFTSYLDRQPGSESNWRMTRVIDYIKAHWDEPITIETLASITGTSARSIFYHFKKSQGQSPMAFVKQIRLDHAKQMLSKPDEASSVRSAAAACGFGNLGHFAKDYFLRFGERPFETLNRHRKPITAVRK